jgi:hypothetical protein
MKLVEHPFPFRYSQVVQVLLMLHWLYMPLVTANRADKPVLSSHFAAPFRFVRTLYDASPPEHYSFKRAFLAPTGGVKLHDAMHFHDTRSSFTTP